MNDWCPENDGAYQAEMAIKHRDSLEEQNFRLRAEITRLRAERDAARATAQRALGAAAEANARLHDARMAAAVANARLAAALGIAFGAAEVAKAFDLSLMSATEADAMAARIAAAIRAMKETKP